ncbi:MAG: D-alanyl-D-alanine carboxypeptidase DacC precursor, partial [Pseudomonadota bacterium]
MTALFSTLRRSALRSALIWAVLSLSLLPLQAQAQARLQVPVAPEVAARAYLLLDVTANQILASRELDMPVEPASLTKLM